jgi:hypothetical protein
MAVERRERQLKGNLIPEESGVVFNTRPVKAAGSRSRATPAWPLGVTSTSRVDRRDDGSPPERRSRQGGACAAKTVIITRCGANCCCTVINGPFPESKELIAGYWILQVQSMDEAVEWAERAPFEGPFPDLPGRVRRHGRDRDPSGVRAGGV